MLQSTNKDDLGYYDDDEDVIGETRPEWVKWYYKRWVTATQLMDAEQKGWYMNLLMHAAIQGDPPGYLPEDEEELAYLAGVKDLDANALRENKRWARVRRKFIESTEFPGLVFNKTMSVALREASRKSKFNRKAAKISWDNRRQRKNLKANAKQTQSNIDADAKHMHYLNLSSSNTSLKKVLEKGEATTVLPLEIDTEEEKRKVTSIPESKSKVTSDDILHIYQFWKNELGLGSRQLTDERKKKIRVRLETDSTVEEIETAIRGCKVSAWHMGIDENSPRPYNDIAQDICRNRGTVEKFISIYENHQRKENNNVNSGHIQTRRESRQEREARIHRENANLFAEE